jgi:hypothetical protein
MGQWQDSALFVLESCAHYFVQLDQTCNAKILAWLDDSKSGQSKYLDKSGMFLLLAKNSFCQPQVVSLEEQWMHTLDEEILTRLVLILAGHSTSMRYLCNNYLPLRKLKMISQKCQLFISRFFSAGSALMLYLEVLKKCFQGSDFFASNIPLRSYLIAAIQCVSQTTLQFSLGISLNPNGTKHIADINRTLDAGNKPPRLPFPLPPLSQRQPRYPRSQQPHLLPLLFPLPPQLWLWLPTPTRPRSRLRRCGRPDDRSRPPCNPDAWYLRSLRPLLRLG